MAEFTKCSNEKVNKWLEEQIAMCQPESVVWIDGSESQLEALRAEAVSTGELIKLNEEKLPGCYYHRTAENDVARVEDRTFICTPTEEEAGPINNWMEPSQMYDKLKALYTGAMKGRTMYIIPYSMGPVGSPFSKIGIELTDSIYVVLNMNIMTRIGQEVMDVLGTDGDFVKCLHAKKDVNPEERYIVHFPQDNAIMSVNSAYGGNVLLGKKCFALRIASYLGKQEGWMAEHMLILGLENPQGEVKYIYAINPEAGFFGVAPGTSEKTNFNALESTKKNTIFTNVALNNDDLTVWWEGLDKNPPKNCTNWLGEKVDGTTYEGNLAHPNSRFTAPAINCPCISSEFENPQGVPISAIVFGGRRAKTAPLVYQARDWEHGVFVGATMASETTAAAAGAVGVVRRDPMAMKPFVGYNMADYFGHWLEMGKKLGDNAPAIFHVNWFRKDDEGNFMWPGFGDNMRVLLWILDRVSGKADAHDSAIGLLPTASDIDTTGLGISAEELDALLSVDKEVWKEDVENIKEYFAQFGDRLPADIKKQLEILDKNLND